MNRMVATFRNFYRYGQHVQNSKYFGEELKLTDCGVPCRWKLLGGAMVYYMNSLESLVYLSMRTDEFQHLHTMKDMRCYYSQSLLKQLHQKNLD